MSTSSAASLVTNEQPYLTVSSSKNYKSTADTHAKTSSLLDENAFSTILDFFKSNGIVEVVESEIVPAGTLYYGDRLKLVFRLTPTYDKHFPLLRGLLGFGKFTSLNVSPHAASKTFHAIISAGNEKNVIDYFQILFSELVSDAEFKKVLKELLGIQNEAFRVYKASLSRLNKTVHKGF
jgi:hypothetical protein